MGALTEGLRYDAHQSSILPTIANSNHPYSAVQPWMRVRWTWGIAVSRVGIGCPTRALASAL
jgi:hypothetical protein